MRKILSLILSAALTMSAMPVVFATNEYNSATPNADIGTQVNYVATGSESYTITVPALLHPSDEGTVTLTGTWASDRTVSVTADESVTLINQLNNTDSADLDITFLGLHKEGSNVSKQLFSEHIVVAEMPANALFGTWRGIFNYNVEIADVTPANS